MVNSNGLESRSCHGADILARRFHYLLNIVIRFNVSDWMMPVKSANGMSPFMNALNSIVPVSATQ